MNWTLVVSTAAVVVAVITAFVQWLHGRRLLKLENDRERERLLAPKRATIEVNFRQGNTIVINGDPPTNTHHCDLVVRNDGPRQARDLVILLDGNPPHESPYTDTKSPSVLDPGAQRVFKLTATNPPEVPVEVVVDVSWVDDSSAPGRVKARGIIAT